MTPSEHLSLDIVDDPASVEAFAVWLTANLNERTPIAIDTETTGLEWWTPAFTRLVQFGNTTSGWAIPIEWHPRLITWALEQVRQSGVSVPMHNSKFDMHALEGDGFPVPHWEQVQDTMVLHHLLHPSDSHALKTISTKMFGTWAGDGDYFLKQAAKKANVKWWLMPVDHPLYWGYGIVDTILTARLFEELYHDADLPHNAYDREMAYTAIMYAAETRGVRIDTEYSRNLLMDWTLESEDTALWLNSQGIENPSSNQQVEQALRKIGWEPDLLTETGQAQLDSLVLKELESRGGMFAEVATALVSYKRKIKWCSTYLSPFMQSDGRVHPSVRTLGAKTGRSSITGPPLQTLPSRDPAIRNAILPEDGCDLYAIDYSGQEYRILAAESGDDAWLAEFAGGKGDPHQLVADQLGVTRVQAKTFNFAMVYGAGNKKLASATGLSMNAVKKFLALYDKGFPGIRRFKDKLEQEGLAMVRNKQEAAVTTIGGRTAVAYPDQLYALTNYKIQGSGADVLKEATCRLDKAGLADYIMLPVHDELTFSFPKGEGAKLSKECEEIMTNTDWYSIPIPAEAEGPYDSWGSKYS
jgi:DNA polymerase-1